MIRGFCNHRMTKIDKTVDYGGKMQQVDLMPAMGGAYSSAPAAIDS
jgi:hypothetical protein